MDSVYHRTAGGVVLDESGRVLTLVRTVERDGAPVHEVRLPKGHADPGETEEAAALREVGEESGYWSAVIVADLGEAVSEFNFRGEHHVRTERCFLMRAAAAQRGEPCPGFAEEALFQPVWQPPTEAEDAMTYASETAFVRRARAWVRANGGAAPNGQTVPTP